MEVKRRKPIAVVEYVLRRLERQAINIGSHPVLIHEGLEALAELREENARLREERDGLPMAERLRRAEIVAGVTGTYREQLTCIDVWLNRREPVKYESATLRHVQEEVERLTRERDEAREELARWRGVPEAMREHGFPEIGDAPIAVTATVAMLVVERDEARAEVKKYHDALVARHGVGPVVLLEELDVSRDEVARLEGEVVRLSGETATLWNEWSAACDEVARLEAVARTAEASRRAHIERAEDFQKEIERLEGLILAWDRECGPDEMLEAEARRIRAQREEGRCSAGVKGCGILFDEHGHTEEGQ